MATHDNAQLLNSSGPRNPYPGELGVVKEGALARVEDLLVVVLREYHAVRSEDVHQLLVRLVPTLSRPLEFYVTPVDFGGGVPGSQPACRVYPTSSGFDGAPDKDAIRAAIERSAA